MKKKKGFGLGISLIAIMLIVCIVLVIMMMTGGKKDTYYGIMKDNTTIEKMISEKDESIEKNVKLPSDSDVKVKKGDFVIVYKLADSDVKVKKVDHDDVPHGLMMKIHDMGKMHMKH
ncbi:DUF4889 domain-containing protein [Staphylococcus aureus]|uniref:DUF4889 domain-containing protein n=1 Tax=Staphylococcus aureus TaxID=1280 RepID=UPI0004465881|nr:DUF4889 domain-containing protein [Staphylococcus aureus]EWL01387.1 hypothetical protein U552_02336 [Staphylococcus aureus H71538]EWV24528.1 hypothetical protein U681_01940 [Staphylococcus aureus T67319]EWW50605.1 hypothetical protein V287_01100 [Staphylococcus aureus H43986]EYG52115.1 hypothetical protein V627_02573 [Staphylococcus aureus T42550]EYK81960.1 hypothetical protein V642_01062 [Staphylococcus aureus T83563]